MDDKCLNCEGLYDQRESNAKKKICFCCDECEAEYTEWYNREFRKEG